MFLSIRRFSLTVLVFTVTCDRDTGRSRGYGLVTLAGEDEADNAINGLNDQELDGKKIKISRI
ncbi:hypothetical protein CPB85DRAFT_1228511 [Mucidula mucida]|nr:hypothetical protein CPB85DRAFT_1228511 [Mucidula mucida]